ncbi:MAG: hypothetical protein ACE5E6_06140 [Phycisphaerae bacterium]
MTTRSTPPRIGRRTTSHRAPRRPRWATPFAGAVAAAIVATGCASRAGPTVRIWTSRYPSPAARSPSAVLADDGTPIARIRLAGAINETLAFRFALKPLSAAIHDPALRVDAFLSTTGRIEPDAVRLFRMHPVPAGPLPGWHIRSVPPDRRDPNPLDVLVPIHAPRGGLPATLSPGTTYHFWADVRIPKGTFEGVYAADINVTADGHRVATIRVELTVRPFILPDDPGTTILVDLDHRKLFQHHIRPDGRVRAWRTDDWRDDPLRGRLDGLLSATLRMLHAHGLAPVLPQLAPITRVDRTGTVALDWSAFDDIVGPCMTGRLFVDRVPLPAWPMPLGRIFPRDPRHDPEPSSATLRLARGYVENCADHFARRGWRSRSFAEVPPRGMQRTMSLPIGPLDPGERTAVRIVRNVAPDVPLLSRRCPQDMAPYGWVDYPADRHAPHDVDIWMPPAQFYDHDVMATERRGGRRTWLAVDRPPFSGTASIHGGPTDTRVLTWQARRLGAELVYLGPANDWPDAATNPAPADCIATDPATLLYPGTAFGLDEPVPSVRLKRLRRSALDAAYATLLDDRGLEYVTAAVAQALAPYAGTDAYRTHFADGRQNGWTADPRQFDTARVIMADALTGKVRPATSRGGDMAAFERDANWRRLMLATRRLDIAVDGVRVRFTGTRSRPRAELECVLNLVNGTRAPLHGTIRLRPGPRAADTGTPPTPRAPTGVSLDPPNPASITTPTPGDTPRPSNTAWAVPPDAHTVPPIPPGASRRITLATDTNRLLTGRYGVMPLPIEFINDDGGAAHRFRARAAYVVAGWAEHDLDIDGDLTDWPPGGMNRASDFVLITGEPADRTTEQRTRPRRGTDVLVLRDDRYLYIGVACAAATNAGTATSNRNAVRYQDLIPVGDELIELLFDPLNARTRSPSDLFHVVVKPTGVNLTERGIAFDPPCGTRSVWAPDIRVATARHPRGWVTEVRIPIDAFGPGAATHTTWGFNITRFDADNHEFSTWSGATRNAYDPMSLGNLCFP